MNQKFIPLPMCLVLIFIIGIPGLLEFTGDVPLIKIVGLAASGAALAVGLMGLIVFLKNRSKTG